MVKDPHLQNICPPHTLVMTLERPYGNTPLEKFKTYQTLFLDYFPVIDLEG